ncbi:hypothetical protein Nepgr_019892 [Nepenthes gracilis]|uniref:Uncharacterized protein n=1 Tax=Nepenthes gracilis TaxID=150966 RepID=A0AAD3SXX2_NEPGR|nr:hypothetical protein Nepgr_019892 [Nepenthes gracilis]
MMVIKGAAAATMASIEMTVAGDRRSHGSGYWPSSGASAELPPSQSSDHPRPFFEEGEGAEDFGVGRGGDGFIDVESPWRGSCLWRPFIRDGGSSSAAPSVRPKRPCQGRPLRAATCSFPSTFIVFECFGHMLSSFLFSWFLPFDVASRCGRERSPPRWRSEDPTRRPRPIR